MSGRRIPCRVDITGRSYWTTAVLTRLTRDTGQDSHEVLDKTHTRYGRLHQWASGEYWTNHMQY